MELNNHKSKKLSSHHLLPVAEFWQQKIKTVPGVCRVGITGELRRGLHSVGRAELVVATESFDDFINSIHPIIDNRRVNKVSEHCIEVTLEESICLLIWVARPHQYGNMMVFTTGSAAHIEQLTHALDSKKVRIELEKIRINNQSHYFGNEPDFYRAFGLPPIPPELREGAGEIELAADQKLPDLINQADLKSDLHIHTKWTDGRASIKEIISKSIQQNLSVIAITDHSPSLLKPRYFDASYLLEQQRQIDTLNKTLKNDLIILKGVEVDILSDGSLDLPNWMLKKMDVVIASLHLALDLPKEIMTDRLIKAIQNPHVDIIGHPGGRSLPSDDCTNLEWDCVFEAAAQNHVALEINSHKHHPFFDDEKIKRAIQYGAILTLNSDTHRLPMMEDSRYGISLARRAGVSSDQIINTWEPQRLIRWLKDHRNGATNN
jgi:DNA polymerase (family 10)